MNYIERPEYMQRLLDLMGTPDIKIITGVRRSGKSELMKAYIRKIQETQPEANIIFVDFFDLKYEGLKEYHALYDYSFPFHNESTISIFLLSKLNVVLATLAFLI